MEDDGASVCTSVCTPSVEVDVLQGAIARLTRALLVADDADIPAIVAERAAMRAEFEERRLAASGVTTLEAARARRGL